MFSVRLLAVVSSITLLLISCSTVPPLREDGIAISEIVQRVKCEIAYAIPKPEGKWPTGRYQWLRNWTAKVDLTLITNDQSVISPGASWILPLRKLGETFTIGAGGGLTNNAIRNESLSFTLSLEELRNSVLDCHLEGRRDLYGHLGLEEWIRSAIAPAEYKILTIGKHAAPGTAKKADTTGGGAKSNLANPKIAAMTDELSTALNYASQAEAALADAVLWSQRAIVQADTVSAPVRLAMIQNAFDADATANARAKDAAEQKTLFNKNYNSLSAAEKLLDQVKNLKVLMDGTTDNPGPVTRANTAAAAADKSIEGIPIDPPIDSIAHQVQFIVVASASVTPNWSLVHFKGPSANGSFASVNETRTHTLNIALGAPGTSVNASGEQLRQLTNLHLDALRLQTSP
jgi:hypothetical protein